MVIPNPSSIVFLISGRPSASLSGQAALSRFCGQNGIGLVCLCLDGAGRREDEIVNGLAHCGPAVLAVPSGNGEPPGREALISAVSHGCPDLPLLILDDKGQGAWHPRPGNAGAGAPGTTALEPLKFQPLDRLVRSQVPGGVQAWGLGTLADRLTPWANQKPDRIVFSIQAALNDDPAPSAETLVFFHDRGLRLIHWMLQDREKIPKAMLWQVSKAGIWNHISGPGLFDRADAVDRGIWMADNPDVVHSYESLCGSPRPDPSALAYGRVPPLPGIPFWQALGSSCAILAELSGRTAKALRCLRTDPAQHRTWTLGGRLEFHFQKPPELDKGILDGILAMVAAGGSVDLTHVRNNLERAYLVAYVTEDGLIVGNSSLKRPRQAFIDRMTGIIGRSFEGFVERGYTSVRPEYRAMGIGEKLLAGLTSRAAGVKIFSIISEDNLATQKIAVRNHTRKIAVYFSEKTGKEMGVWMPEHMIDDAWELPV